MRQRRLVIAGARPLNADVMRRLELLAIGALFGLASTALVVAADDLPKCEPSLRSTEFTGPMVLDQNCRLAGEVIVSFTVRANGRTTNVVVETVRATGRNHSGYCVSDYARALVRGSRFPKRDQACHHVLTFNFADVT